MINKKAEVIDDIVNKSLNQDERDDLDDQDFCLISLCGLCDLCG